MAICSKLQQDPRNAHYRTFLRVRSFMSNYPISIFVISNLEHGHRIHNILRGKNRAVLKGFDECQRQHWWIEKLCKDIGNRTEMRLFHGDMASRNVNLHVDPNGQIKATIIDLETLCVRPSYATYPDSTELDSLNVCSSDDGRTPFKERYAQCLKGTKYPMYEVESKTCSKIDDPAKLDMLIFHMVNDLLNLLQAPIFTPAGVDECFEFFHAWDENVHLVLHTLFAKRLSLLWCNPASDVKSDPEPGSHSGLESVSTMDSESVSVMEVDSGF